MDTRSTRHRKIPPVTSGETGLTPTEPRRAATQSRERIAGRLRCAMSSTRYLLALVSVTLVGLSLLTICWGVAKTVALAHALVWEDAWEKTTALAKVISIIDVFLIATTTFVVAVGLWQLFVTHLELPAWMEFKELRSLKVVVAELLVLTVTVKLIEDFLLDAAGTAFLREAAGVAILNLTLIAYATLRSSRS